MAASKTVLPIVIFIFQLQDAAMKSIYVSLAGNDTNDCGPVLSPCKKIRYAVKKARHSQDEILVDGNHQNRPAVYVETGISLSESIFIKGVNGKPAILCSNAGPVFEIINSSAQRVKVYFENFLFIIKMPSTRTETIQKPNAFISLKNSSLSLKNCTFRGVERPVDLLCQTCCKIKMVSCKLFHPKVGLRLMGTGQFHADIRKSDFIGKPHSSISAIHVGKNDSEVGALMNISISSCIFSHFSSALIIFTRVNRTFVRVDTSSFLNNHISKRGTAEESTGSSITVRDDFDFDKPVGLLNISMKIQSCTFENNTAISGAGISIRLKHSELYANFSHSIFTGNRALVSGGAVELLILNSVYFYFVLIKSEFSDNSASFGDYSKLDYQYPYYSTFGSGGAITVARKCVTLNGFMVSLYCRFKNNSAQNVGGTIFGRAFLMLQHLHIEPPKTDAFETAQGKIIYSVGRTTFDNVTINVLKLSFGRTDVEITGTLNAVYFAYDSKFTCPRESIVKVNTNSQESVSSGMIQFMSLRCDPCDIGTYTVDSSMFYRREIKGSKCRQCPFGGTCLTGFLKPQEAFWGYRYGEEGLVRFIQLPVGYGCTKDLCKKYDSCAANRHGRLCGLCKQGFTESMLSTICIKNEACNSKIFWSIAVGLLCFYFIIFICKRDLLSFLQLQFSSFKRNYPSENGSASLSPIDQANSAINEAPKNPAILKNRITRNKSKVDFSMMNGLLKILFYFYQIEAMLETYDSVVERSVATDVIHSVKNFFNFDFIPNFGSPSCAMLNITSTSKQLIRLGLVFALLLALVSTSGFTKLAGFHSSRTLNNRGLLALFDVLLLSYAAIAKTTFTMFACHEFGRSSVLYIQGNVTCYQNWQYAFMMAGIFWVLPFCAFVIVLPGLLFQRTVTTGWMFFGCLFPLPFMVHFIFQSRMKRYRPVNGDQTGSQSSQGHVPRQDRFEKDAVVKAIVKDQRALFTHHVNSSCYSWEGIYILRRLVLVSIFVFVKDPIYKLYLVLFCQILFLLHHVYVKPYKNAKLNALEALSLTLLVIINCMSLFTTFDFTHGNREVGENLLLLKIFGWMEAVAVCLAPLAMMLALFGLCIGRIACFIASLISRLFIQCGGEQQDLTLARSLLKGEQAHCRALSH